MTFAQFAASRGLTGDAEVIGHIHAGLRSAPTTQTYARWNKRTLERLQAERTAARAAYRAAIEAGEVREPTNLESLEATAAFGHPDNAATHAARRLLAKRADRQTEERKTLWKSP